MNSFGDSHEIPVSLNTVLANRVKVFLAAQRGGFRRINVHAEADTVRLSGSVTSFFLRQAAVVMAKRVAGVRNIIDDLVVEGEEALPSSEDWR